FTLVPTECQDARVWQEVVGSKGTAARKQQESDIFLAVTAEREPVQPAISFDMYVFGAEAVTIDRPASADTSPCLSASCPRNRTSTCSPPRLPPRRIAAHSFSP